MCPRLVPRHYAKRTPPITPPHLTNLRIFSSHDRKPHKSCSLVQARLVVFECHQTYSLHRPAPICRNYPVGVSVSLCGSQTSMRTRNYPRARGSVSNSFVPQSKRQAFWYLISQWCKWWLTLNRTMLSVFNSACADSKLLYSCTVNAEKVDAKIEHEIGNSDLRPMIHDT